MLKGGLEKGDNNINSSEMETKEDILQAAILALTALFRSLIIVHIYSVIYNYLLSCYIWWVPSDIFNIILSRGGGKTGKKVVEQSYAAVLCALTLQLGSCHGLAGSAQKEPLWYITVHPCVLQ